MHPGKKPFHGLGIIIEGAIATAQAIALGSSTAVQHDRIKKAQRKSSSLLSMLHQQRLAEIEKEGKKREGFLHLKAEEALITEKGIRTATYLGVTTVLVASLVLLYFLLRGNRNEK